MSDPASRNDELSHLPQQLPPPSAQPPGAAAPVHSARGPTAKPTGKGPGAGSLVLNILWLVLSGFWLFLGYLFAGVMQCVTIIGIPFGIQSFKLAGFALWPFGRSVVKRPGASTSLSLVGNVIWLLLSGLWLALAHALLGVLLCITIIGIPLGLGNFKLIPLALLPFGKDIVRNGTVTTDTMVSF